MKHFKLLYVLLITCIIITGCIKKNIPVSSRDFHGGKAADTYILLEEDYIFEKHTIPAGKYMPVNSSDAIVFYQSKTRNITVSQLFGPFEAIGGIAIMDSSIFKSEPTGCIKLWYQTIGSYGVKKHYRKLNKKIKLKLMKTNENVNPRTEQDISSHFRFECYR